MAKFLTEEWCERFKENGFKVFGPGVTPTKLSLTMVEVYENCDEDRMNDYIWEKCVLKDGVLQSIEFGTDEDDQPDGDYVIYGDQDAYVKVLDGSVPLAKAAISGMFQIDGNLLKMMKLLNTYEKVMDCKRDNGNTEW